MGVSRVTTRDLGFHARMVQIRDLARVKMSVGVHADEGGAKHQGGEGETIAEIADAHEFGLGVPRRSFVRSWVDANKERNNRLIYRSLLRVVQGQARYAEALHGLGSVFVADMRLRIARREIVPPLAQATIDRKLATTPLLETGQLSSSIRYSYRGDRPAVSFGRGDSPVNIGGHAQRDVKSEIGRRARADAKATRDADRAAKKATRKPRKGRK